MNLDSWCGVTNCILQEWDWGHRTCISEPKSLPVASSFVPVLSSGTKWMSILYLRSPYTLSQEFLLFPTKSSFLWHPPPLIIIRNPLFSRSGEALYEPTQITYSGRSLNTDLYLWGYKKITSVFLCMVLYVIGMILWLNLRKSAWRITRKENYSPVYFMNMNKSTPNKILEIDSSNL